MSGYLIAVVGPSGVGKDSVIDGILSQAPDVRRLPRIITRDPKLGGEAFTSVSEARFRHMRDAGAFCLHWSAHGLSYGIPTEALNEVRNGAVLIANLSRGMLEEAANVFPAVIVLHLTASPETLADRLASRGREDKEMIARRLARAELTIPDGLTTYEIANEGPLDQTVARALAIIGNACAR